MKSLKLSLIVLLFFSFCSFTHLYAQLKDTVIIYDTVYITDTVWAEEPVSLEKMNHMDSEKLLAYIPSKMKEIEPESLYSFKNLEFNISDESRKIDWSQYRDHLNFFVKGNLAAQTHWVSKKFGKDGELPIISSGFGAGSRYNLNNWLAFEPKLAFIQKGCQLGYLYDSIDNQGRTRTKIGLEGYQNRFNYLSADFLLKIGKNGSSKFSPYIYAGLRGDLLLWHKIDYLVDYLDFEYIDFNKYYTQSTDYKDFHRLNYGWVFGFGSEVGNMWFIQFEVNNDLGYVAKGYRFRAQNIVASINIGLYIGAFVK